MAKLKLRGKDLIDIGYPQNKSISIALDIMQKHYKKESKPKALDILRTRRVDLVHGSIEGSAVEGHGSYNSPGVRRRPPLHRLDVELVAQLGVLFVIGAKGEEAVVPMCRTENSARVQPAAQRDSGPAEDGQCPQP